jgi:hypothetical protein
VVKKLQEQVNRPVSTCQAQKSWIQAEPCSLDAIFPIKRPSVREKTSNSLPLTLITQMRLAICNETSIATELIRGGYDKWVSVEVFDTSISPETLAAESMRHLRDAFPA